MKRKLKTQQHVQKQLTTQIYCPSIRHIITYQILCRRRSRQSIISIFSFLVFLEYLGAASQRHILGESHGIDKTSVGNHAIVAGEDDSGFVPAWVRSAAFGIWTLDQNCITCIISMVTLYQDVVCSSWVGHTLNLICNSWGVPVFAHNFNERTWQVQASYNDDY